MPLFSNVEKELREEKFNEWSKSIGLTTSPSQDMLLKIRDLKKIDEIEVSEEVDNVELFTFEGTEIFAYGTDEGLLSVLEYDNLKDLQKEYER